MKTIEERAKEYSLKDFDGYYTGRERAVEEGYIAGAKEQKTITTNSMMERCKRVLSGQKLELIDKACDILTKWGVFELLAKESEEGFSESVYKDQFIKCMEGEL